MQGVASSHSIVSSQGGFLKMHTMKHKFNDKVQNQADSNKKQASNKVSPQTPNVPPKTPTTDDDIPNHVLPTEAENQAMLTPKLPGDDFMKDVMNFGEEDNVGNLEDGRYTKIEYEKLKLIELGILVLSLVGVILSVYAYDLEYDELEATQYTCTVVLWLVTITSILQAIVIVFRYAQKNKFLKARNTISLKEGIFLEADTVPIITEVLITLAAPMPWFQNWQIPYFDQPDNTWIYYHINDVLCIFMLLRLYIVLRVVVGETMYYSPSAQRLCDMYGADKGYWFSIKCLMKNNPFLLIVICMGITIAVFGYALRICERPICRGGNCAMDYSYYSNSMWNVIVTMTTVGYGDFYPKTVAGRIITFILCIWGVFLVSMMVVTLTNTLTMQSGETKALAVLTRLELRKELKSEAAFVLTLMAKYGLLRKKPDFPGKAKTLETFIVKIKIHLDSCKKINRNIKSIDDGASVTEEMNRQFDRLRDDMNTMQDSQKHIEELLQNLIGVFGMKSPKEDKRTKTIMKMSASGNNAASNGDDTPPSELKSGFIKTNETEEDSPRKPKLL
jgi:potassium intermediate/small conductance calcium-activated channel subfamily N protein 2